MPDLGVAATLERCRTQGRAALIGYLPVGFPDVAASLDIMVAAVEAGLDILEIGVPYSDPLMDGPVIQAAAAEALAKGCRVDDVFPATDRVRAAGVPPLVMSYWNLVLHRGVDTFADELAAAGGAGIITPDLIPEEAGEWLAASERTGLDRVFLVAPSSTAQRLARVAEHCRGFVYAASTMGVTGVRGSVDGAARDLVARTRAVSDVPVCVGLGVSTREHAAEIAGYADGVIVGSALVRAIERDRELGRGGHATLVATVAALAAGVREGVR